MIDLVGLDGDDTLWHSEEYFARTGDALADLLGHYAEDERLRALMLERERANLALFGYGVKGFTLSMIETAIEISEGRVSTAEIQAIIDAGKDLLGHPVDLLDGVAETVATLAATHRVVIITKGDLFHQETKVATSGLADVVHGVEIVTEKDPATYRRVLERQATSPERFVMVGNSMRSDVLPVLELGGHAVHIPYHVTWELEVAERPDARHDRFHELERLADLPDLVSGL